MPPINGRVSILTRADVARRGRHLQYVTILWNSAECLVALVAGFVAGSIALVGFWFEFAVEVNSRLAALFRILIDQAQAGRATVLRNTLQVLAAMLHCLSGFYLNE